MLGQINYCFVGESCIAVTYKRPENGACCLVLLTPSGAHEFGQECLPENLRSLTASPDGQFLYFIGGQPSKPGGIYKWRVPDVLGAKGAEPTFTVGSRVRVVDGEQAASVKVKSGT